MNAQQRYKQIFWGSFAVAATLEIAVLAFVLPRGDLMLFGVGFLVCWGIIGAWAAILITSKRRLFPATEAQQGVPGDVAASRRRA